MKALIRSPKDFWAGLLYAGFGAAAVLIARDYGMGSSSRMGPAYFPTVLGSLLLLIGVASLVRSFFVRGRTDRRDRLEGDVPGHAGDGALRRAAAARRAWSSRWRR